MDELDFEGSAVLEKLAEFDLVDEFYEAIDSDNRNKIIRLLTDSGQNSETIKWVLSQLEEE